MATEIAVTARQSSVLQLSLNGYSQREIARQLKIGVDTVTQDLRAMLHRQRLAHAMDAEQWRVIISARLDDSRVRLRKIARNSTASDNTKIAAERALVDIETRRANLLGVQVRGDMGDLADWLKDLAGRRTAVDDIEQIAKEDRASRTLTVEPESD